MLQGRVMHELLAKGSEGLSFCGFEQDSNVRLFELLTAILTGAEVDHFGFSILFAIAFRDSAIDSSAFTWCDRNSINAALCVETVADISCMV